MKRNNNYHIITIGCQMNVSDSERLAAFLEKNGWQAVSLGKKITDAYLADLVIINTCGIRQMAEDRVYGLVNSILQTNPEAKIVITGCLSRRLDVKRRLEGRVLAFMPINEMFQLPSILAGKKLKEKFSLDDFRLKSGEKYLKIKPKYSRQFSACVPIGNGCNNFCSYCVVPYARGREVYRQAKDIIKDVKGLLNNGYKEIILLAQNVNSYKNGNYDFSKLLQEIASLPGDFWVRFSSSHPKDLSPKLIKVITSNPKICSHLHLAVQSGDDDILKAMNRKYTVSRYEDLVKKVRQARPEMAITTDVIVGFPGETKNQFNNTVKLFKRLKFDLVYISQYSPRYGTASYLLKDNVSSLEKKRREEVLDTLLKKEALLKTKKYIGKEIKVLVEGVNKRGKYYGKTSSYQTVLIEKSKNKKDCLLGRFVMVKIKEALPFALSGELVQD